MKFSLVLATLGRVDELRRCFESLAAQTHRDFEVVIIDQNPDDRLVPLVQAFAGSLELRHLRSAKGLSRARNVGLRAITGDVVAFPDDDCWYPTDVLARVAALLEANPGWGGVCGRSIDAQGRDSSGRWDTAAGAIERTNVWRRAISYTVFLRRPLVDRLGGFEEDLGVGADSPWQSGEETDFVLRALGAGGDLRYDPEVRVHHENPVLQYDVRARTRARGYGMGMGRVLRLHRYPVWYVSYLCARPLGGSLLALLTGDPGRARFQWASFEGRVRGWLGSSAGRTR